MKIYLDTCIIIYLIEGADPWNKKVEAEIRKFPDANFLVSDLVRMECKVGPLKKNDLNLAKEYDDFFNSIQVLPLSSSVFDLAAILRASYRFKTPDALHLAVASLHECDEFWTNDARLTRASDIIFRIIS